MALKLKFVQKVSLSEDRVVFELLSILDFVHSFIDEAKSIDFKQSN